LFLAGGSGGLFIGGFAFGAGCIRCAGFFGLAGLVGGLGSLGLALALELLLLDQFAVPVVLGVGGRRRGV
jgi:hypothetical protein